MSLASKKYKQHLEAAYTYTSWSEKYYFMNYFLNKLLQMPESNFRYVCVTNKYNHHHWDPSDWAGTNQVVSNSR